ncbi:hypothetical protein IT072_02455 [Leifsonia sp. ZF2019]|uniref:hypothetical protein n=1 Tax=Leifsonia sp. ZF2019 TaxID=2781978 RepID=UPI001CBB5EA9|nr:hypothetical protein [Leifsonia sp. ZF2019]UAJ79959.1 hypothetical protein IT072_02455 [Leifsonia sp. ZF2019]
MPELAGHIDVKAHLASGTVLNNAIPIPIFALTIDGEEFPWHVTEDGVRIEVTDRGVPAITITIPDERVTVDHSINSTAGEAS